MKHDLMGIQSHVADLFLSQTEQHKNAVFSTKPDVLDKRIAVYRSNLQLIYASALRNVYPVIYQLVGDVFFSQLAALFEEKYPSQSGDLHEFGVDFPIFLEEEESVQAYPYFAAVAALELKLHQSYYAADADAISLNEFFGSAGAVAPQHTLRFHPACVLFKSKFAAIPVYLAHQHSDVEPIELDLGTPSYGLISRDAWRLQVTPISEAQYASLNSLYIGHSLEDSLEVAMGIDPEFPVAEVLRSWFDLGIFIDFTCKYSFSTPD